jgi:hypothetical protein
VGRKGVLRYLWNAHLAVEAGKELVKMMEIGSLDLGDVQIHRILKIGIGEITRKERSRGDKPGI